MRLTVKNLLHVKSCSLIAGSVALLTMAASQAAAGRVTALDKIVSGVPTANPVVITDNVFSPESTPGLIAHGSDLLENSSAFLTQFGIVSDGCSTEPHQN